MQQTEVYVDMVHPQSGEVLPALPWVAEYLQKTGWKRKESVEKTKKEETDGKKDDKSR